MENSQAVAWVAIADHIKDAYINKFGAKAWYTMLDGKHYSGIEAYKTAVTQLACVS
ncbi:MAG: hypothetical protein ACXW1D_00460 [Halobacteriota archaeon]